MSVDIETKVHALLSEVVGDVASDDIRGLNPDDNLFKLGILESVLLIQLVEKIEDAFSISVEDRELSPDYFLSIARMTLYVQQKLSEAPQSAAPADS